jgi:hypothetical protein
MRIEFDHSIEFDHVKNENLKLEYLDTSLKVLQS